MSLKHCKHCRSGFMADGDLCGKCREESAANLAHLGEIGKLSSAEVDKRLRAHGLDPAKLAELGRRLAAEPETAKRTCVALFSPRPGVFDPTTLCGEPAHYQIAGDDLCLYCAKRRAKINGSTIGERDPWKHTT